jgi:serine/threonine-protein kinase HipA
MEKLMLRKKEFEEMFRRMVFNYVYNNHDDHLKNHSFLMNKSGEWHLAPAYDITYLNTIGHMNNFLKINGKQSKNVTLEDFMEIAKRHDIKKPEKIIEEVENGIGFFISSVHEHMKNSLDSEFMIKNVNYLLDSTKKITSIIEQKSLSQLQ